MGCWNKTCGLSNLHIIAGSPVYVFVLQRENMKERCYPSAFWRPTLLPFDSVYNDYGAGEDSSGVALPFIEAGLRRHLVEVEQGDNECHDIPVKVEGFSIDTFFEAVHENRLDTRTPHGVSETDFVMFRKDVVDDVLAHYEVEQYVGDGKGTTGYGNNYIVYQFADVVADIPAFIDEMERKLDTTDCTATEKLLLRWSIRDLSSVFPWKHPNKVAKYVSPNPDYASLVQVSEELTTLLIDGKRDEAEALLYVRVLGGFLNMFFSDTRRNWAPMGHEGSQSQEAAGYRVLAAATVRALDVEEARWKKDNDE